MRESSSSAVQAIVQLNNRRSYENGGELVESEAAFQHVATFYSLIVGLAVANVFSAMGKAATTTARVRWYWMHTSAAAMLLMLMAQDWWFLLSWDEIRVSHAILVFLLARAGVLYFAASLLLPEDTDNADGIIDLREHMLRMRKRFFVTLAIFPILDFVDTLLKGRGRISALGGPYYLVYEASFFGMMLIAALSRTERPAGIVVMVMIGVLVLSIVSGALQNGW
jgi:hypothetical protein